MAQTNPGYQFSHSAIFKTFAKMTDGGEYTVNHFAAPVQTSHAKLGVLVKSGAVSVIHGTIQSKNPTKRFNKYKVNYEELFNIYLKSVQKHTIKKMKTEDEKENLKKLISKQKQNKTLFKMFKMFVKEVNISEIFSTFEDLFFFFSISFVTTVSDFENFLNFVRLFEIVKFDDVFKNRSAKSPLQFVIKNKKKLAKTIKQLSEFNLFVEEYYLDSYYSTMDFLLARLVKSEAD